MSKFTGVVKWFDNDKGYGFISANDGNDVFVHHSNVKENGHCKDLHEGEEVTFDVIDAPKGPSAINVHKN
ncbi:cold-shock DNA-binding domain-containing protein [[Clostridium] sordellii]|uniref:cold-shock protein n=1 Tax=Paraclostridium sordellii TaxID=1505 RepID=UPI0005DF883C|nr:cold shock domain-containing protein [Paeniclostridium sordellii]MDU1455816.1 cold shock domain-containing protein [Paeniclostridium sordellii]CEO04630.1 cold-shock DNA-binding domain-containing protein [[Clostridium] sordellii] [Paeniclostridium sordellii]